MDFPTPTGTGRAVVNGCPQNISWRPANGAFSDGHIVTLNSGGEIHLTDYDEKLQFHVSASEDGSHYYHTLSLLGDGEPDPALTPTTAELRETATLDLMPLMDAVSEEQLHPDDLNYARLLFTNPDCISRVANKHGSVKKGREAIIEYLLRHTPPL